MTTTIGIDIGSINMAITVLQGDDIISHYHFNLTHGKSIRSINICNAIYLMLDEVIFTQFDNQLTKIQIEEQLCKNTTCSVMQYIVQTIFYMKQYNQICTINSRNKYKDLKLAFNGKVPKKAELCKHIQLDSSKFVFRQYNKKTGLFEDAPPSSKFDDIIDSYLVAACDSERHHTEDKPPKKSRAK